MLRESILLAILTIFIIARVIISDEFHSIAKLKWYTGSKYFVFSFLFGLAGWLIVVSLPEKRSTELNQENTSSYSSYSTTDRKELLAKRAAAEAVLKGKNELSDYQRKSLLNLIQTIDKKLGNL